MTLQTHVRRVRFLYKAVLRLHKGLPPELQELGNVYVKDEFRRHKNCSRAEADEFVKQWTSYAMTLSQQVSIKGIVKSSAIGVSLDEKVLDQMRDDQIQQLYDLMQAASGNTEDGSSPPASEHKNSK